MASATGMAIMKPPQHTDKSFIEEEPRIFGLSATTIVASLSLSVRRVSGIGGGGGERRTKTERDMKPLEEVITSWRRGQD